MEAIAIRLEAIATRNKDATRWRPSLLGRFAVGLLVVAELPTYSIVAFPRQGLDGKESL